jgi:NADH-quinone oxidoreductase subunit G
VAGMLEAVRGDRVEVLYLLAADELPVDRLGAAFVIYQGHHGDAGANRADVILPGAAYTEKDATYVNTEGRVQRTQRAIFPPGDAREDWSIVRALSEALGHKLPYDSLAAVRAGLRAAHPSFAGAGAPAPFGELGRAGALDAAAFVSPITSYYMTDPISRASPTMAKCIQEIEDARVKATGSDD